MIQLVTPFPFLLDYSYYTPLLLRLTVGVYLFAIALKSIKGINEENKVPETKDEHYIHITFRTVAVVAALSLIIGVYMQIGAILTLVLLFAAVADKRVSKMAGISQGEISLLIIITLSLLVTGAGPYAIDLPL